MNEIKIWGERLGSVAAMIVSLFFVFIYWALVGALLQPWDGYTAGDRPPAGSLESNINNYFESGPGTNLIYILLAISILVILVRLAKKRESVTQLFFNTAAAYVLYLVAGFIVVIVTALLFRGEGYEVGFHPLEILVHLALIVGLYILQYRIELLGKKTGPKRS